MYYPINEELARRAKESYSHFDYDEGSATYYYRKKVDEAYAIAEEAKKTVESEYHAKIDYYADMYAHKLAENINKRHEIEARVPSVMIAGASNFPVERKLKQNKALDKIWQERREIESIKDKIQSIGHGGIMSDDKNAIVKLEHKLEELESIQTKMKTVNAYYRKHKTLDGCPNITEEEAEQLKTDMIKFNEDVPFYSYTLANNNANIRRTRQRVEELKKEAERQAAGDSAEKQYDGFILRENAENCRIQFIFGGKPDDETRSLLKSYGFRWSPKEIAWQRLLNENGRRAAQDIIKMLNGGNE